MYRTGYLKDKGHFIDAKRRVIYSTTADDKIKKVCAEPSSDILSAIAAGFEKSSGKSEARIGESAAQTSRIATAELIREWLYRTCETYLNGALEKEMKLLNTKIDKQKVEQKLLEQLLKEQQEEQDFLRKKFEAKLKTEQEKRERLRQQLIEKQQKYDQLRKEQLQ